jgi:integrase
VAEVFAAGDAAPARYQMLVLFGAFTSLRFAELVALTRHDVDLDKVEITVQKPQANLRGGRRKINKSKKRAAGAPRAGPAGASCSSDRRVARFGDTTSERSGSPLWPTRRS